jgi:hypothetical protein
VDPGGITGRDFIPLNFTVPPGQHENENENENAFDSHLCFAAPPVHTPQGERLYYMGSNGPHSAPASDPPRNASLGLAHLRTDGFAGISGTGTLTTVPLHVAGPILTLTIDLLATGGSVAVGAFVGSQPVAGLSLADCVQLSSNTTNGEVRFKTGANFGHLVGETVTLKFEITKAILYTTGWTAE